MPDIRPRRKSIPLVSDLVRTLLIVFLFLFQNATIEINNGLRLEYSKLLATLVRFRINKFI